MRGMYGLKRGQIEPLIVAKPDFATIYCTLIGETLPQRVLTVLPSRLQ
jgi:hypothetical protein